MVEKEHSKLLRDIRRYCTQLDESKIGFVDFFQESNYEDSKGEIRPCYLITKQGCEFIAHKLTGTKGTAFTAKYILRFHEMEQALQQEPPRIEQRTIPALPRKKDNWYNQNAERINQICITAGWTKKYLYHKILLEVGDIYDLAEIRKLYKEVYGCMPQYAMDIVHWYPELTEIADRYLDYLEKILWIRGI